MDRDQQFYTDEEVESRDTGVSAEEQDPMEAQEGEIDDNGYFMELLGHLRNLIEMSKRIPMTGRSLVDSDSCLRIIDDLEKNLPQTIQFCQQMYKEKDRILSEASDTAKRLVVSSEMRINQAKQKAREEAAQTVSDAETEADAIIADAQERADRMVAESEVVRRADDEARSIRNEARVAAEEMRLKANHDAYKLLESAENQLAEASERLRTMRKQLGEDEN